MNSFWRIFIITIAAMLTAWAATYVLDLISTPDTFTVAMGVGAAAALVVAWYYGIGWFRSSAAAEKARAEKVRTDAERLEARRRARSKSAAVALASMILVTSGACTRVGAGHVGIKVHYAGTDRGVDSYPTSTGWVFYFPPSSTVFEWPTFMQNVTWEGAEAFSFNSKEGMQVNGAFSLSFWLTGEKTPHFYVKFRTDDLKEWSHGYLHNIARDAINETSSKLEIEQIYGTGKEAFVEAVKARIQAKVAEYGVNVDQFGVIGQLALPREVVDSLNAKIAATQNAIRTENELRQAEAEAKKTVATAQGEAEAAIARAEGQAKSNRLIQQTITKELIEWRQLQILSDKWDGKYPTVLGGDSAQMLIGIPNATGGGGR